MIKKCLIGFTAAIALLIAVLALSPASTLWLTNQLLSEEQGQIDCLNYRFNSLTEIEIDHLCWLSSAVEIELNAALFDISNHTLLIDTLDISLLSADKSNSEAPTAVPHIDLPSYMPAIQINALTLMSGTMSEPIKAAVTQLSQHTFEIVNDWRAVITIQRNTVDVKLDWTPQLVTPFLSSEMLAQVKQMQWDAPIRSQFQLKDQHLTSEHLFTLGFIYPTQDCDIDVTAGGAVRASADLTLQSASIDLHDLAILANLQSCPLVENLPEEFQLGTVSIEIQDPISVDRQNLIAPAIKLSTMQPLATSLVIKDLEIIGRDELNASINLDISDPSEHYFESSGQISVIAGKPNINLDNNKLRVTNKAIFGAHVTELEADFTVQYNDTFSLHGQAALQQADFNKLIAIDGFTSEFQAQGENLEKLNIELNNQLKKFSAEGLVLSDIKQATTFNLSSLNALSGESQSTVGLFATALFALPELTLDSQVNGNIADTSISSIHQIQLKNNLGISVNQNQSALNVKLEQHSATTLNPILQQLLPDMTLFEGSFWAYFDYDLSNQLGQGQIALSDFSALQSNLLLTGLDFKPSFTFNSAGLQLPKSKLTISEIYNGATLSNISAELESISNQLAAANVSGELFEGKLQADHLWLDKRDQQVTVKLTDLNLASILNMQDKGGINTTGIEINGLISGTLPITLNNLQPSVTAGILTNVGGGTLKIKNNQAFEAIKHDQPSISEELALLENLEYDSINTSINMTSQGQTFLDISLKGKNPDQNQALNFNYTHDQNLFTLFRGLRIADEFKDKIEQRLSKLH